MKMASEEDVEGMIFLCYENMNIVGSLFVPLVCCNILFISPFLLTKN